MIIGRMYVGIRDHFDTRIIEWLFAGILLLWGVNASFTTGYFDRNAWALLADWAPGDPARVPPAIFWGSAATLIALMRITALAINGTFHDTWWSRFSPHVRALMAFLSIFFWTAQTLSLWSAHYLWIGLGPPALYFAADFYIIVRTSSDARHSDEVYRNGRSRP